MPSIQIVAAMVHLHKQFLKRFKAATWTPGSVVLGGWQQGVDDTSARVQTVKIVKAMEDTVLQKTAKFVLILGVAYSFSAVGDDSLAKFRGGIAVNPVSSAAGVANADGTSPNVNRNVVRGINPPGQIWRITDLSADISVDGHIRVNGKGLLLAGGNGIGGNAGQSVFATLICEAAAPFTLHNTTVTGVPIGPNGDFQIDDQLTPTPGDCASPVLLIRNVAGAWFAAGIPALQND